MLTIHLWLYSPLLDLGRFFSFVIFYTAGRAPWTGDQSVARPLPAHRTAQTQNKGTQKFMPRVGVESTIPVFKQAKRVHALDRAATVICKKLTLGYQKTHISRVTFPRPSYFSTNIFTYTRERKGHLSMRERRIEFCVLLITQYQLRRQVFFE
jgi:hypothetical protein